MFIKSFLFSSLGYSYERLDGSIRGEERNLAVKNFSSKDIFVFLLSTKAGNKTANMCTQNNSLNRFFGVLFVKWKNEAEKTIFALSLRCDQKLFGLQWVVKSLFWMNFVWLRPEFVYKPEILLSAGEHVFISVSVAEFIESAERKGGTSEGDEKRR